MKRFTRGSTLWVPGLLLGAVLAAAAVAGCGSVDGEREIYQPTQPTPGTGISIRGTMTITPAGYTLTTKNGSTGGGAYAYYQLTGGKPPFYWTNSLPSMGTLMPIDELGSGFPTRAKYTVRDYAGTGVDTISVRDSAGDIISATFTKTIEDATAPAILPATVTVGCGNTVNLTASLGDGSYRWTTSVGSGVLSSDSGNQVRVGRLSTETDPNNPVRPQSALPCGSTVTVIVTSAGLTGTATITVGL